MSKRQGKRIGRSQQAVLQILSTYGLTTETDVAHWATVEYRGGDRQHDSRWHRGALLTCIAPASWREGQPPQDPGGLRGPKSTR
jgi:hypothetical protein